MGYCEFICERGFREQHYTDLWCTLYDVIKPPLQNASSKLLNVKKAPEQHRTKHWMLLNKGPRYLISGLPLRATLNETVGDEGMHLKYTKLGVDAEMKFKKREIIQQEQTWTQTA